MGDQHQPLGARSLDLGLRHLGWLVVVTHATRCAVCGEPIAASTHGIEAPGAGITHVACGELHEKGQRAAIRSSLGLVKL